jgi:Co/Zn/Cd efflux system component
MIGAALLFFLNGTIVLGIRPARPPSASVRTILIEMGRDSISSAGMLLTGAAVLLTHTRIGDPVVGLLTAVLMAWASWMIVRENVTI